MIIKKDLAYKIMLSAMLLIPVLYSSLELNISIGIVFWLTLLMEKKPKINKTVLNTVSPLLIIFFIALLVTFFYRWYWYDILKDIAFLLKPILFISIGYRLTQKINDKNQIFKIIIYLGVLFATIHTINAFYWIVTESFEINALRRYAGKSNYIELLALYLLLVNKKGQKYFSVKLKFFRFILVVLFASFILYFSRAMFVGLFLLFITYKGYTKITTKGLFYFSLFLMLSLCFYYYLNSIELTRGATGFEGLLYKIKIAPTEIFTSVQDISISNHASLWDHWRAYEANRAIDQLKGTPYSVGLIFGQGLGALVDLGFVAPLSNISTQFIPKLHNGFAHVLFKTGILGLLCLLGFLINLYLKGYIIESNNRIWFFNNIMSGIGLYFVFTGLIIGGIYNQADILTFFLGGILFLKNYYKIN